MSRLPPPPRGIRLELEREEQRLIKTVTPGEGVMAHAAYSAWRNATE